MSSLLSSPRRRRRLAWLGSIALVAAAFVVAGIVWGSSGKNAKPTGGKPDLVAANPPTVNRSAKAMGQIQTVAARFISTAVYRNDLDAAWDLSAPSLRTGISRKEWRTGNIPVTPYPEKNVELVKWKLDYSFPGLVGMKVDLIAKPSSNETGLVGDLELRQAGSGANRHWLVDAWVPMGGGQALGRAITPGLKTTSVSRARISGTWLIVPVGAFVLLGLSIPLALGVRGWRRRLHAERAYTSSSRPS